MLDVASITEVKNQAERGDKKLRLDKREVNAWPVCSEKAKVRVHFN